MTYLNFHSKARPNISRLLERKHVSKWKKWIFLDDRSRSMMLYFFGSFKSVMSGRELVIFFVWVQSKYKFRPLKLGKGKKGVYFCPFNLSCPWVGYKAFDRILHSSLFLLLFSSFLPYRASEYSLFSAARRKIVEGVDFFVKGTLQTNTSRNKPI